jgi:membrane protease YdiL (CAAX protease family)
MRAFWWFLAVIVATLLVAAALAYPLFVAVHPSFPAWPFDRVATRLWQLLMLAALIFVMRHLRLHAARDFGYGAPRPRWLRQFGAGLLAGVLTMVPISLAMLVLGARVVNPGLATHDVVHVLGVAALSGLAVGFIEESFFRGLMLGAVLRELRRPALAIALVAAVYASVHFLASVRIPPEAVSWTSGFALLKGALAHFLAPGSIADAWLALFAVGLLLGACAWWTGNIGLGVGLHAAWVFVLRATIGISHEDPAAPLAWLISSHDGFTGWLVLAWTLLISIGVLLASPRFRHWRRTL